MGSKYNQPEQLQTNGIAPEIYSMCQSRVRTVERTVESTFVALRAIIQEDNRSPNRSFYGSRIAEATIMPNKIEVPAGVEGKLVGMSDQAEWLKSIRQQISEIHDTNLLQSPAISEHLTPDVPLADFPITYEDMYGRGN